MSFGVVAAVVVVGAVTVMYFGRKYYLASGDYVDSMIRALTGVDEAERKEERSLNRGNSKKNEKVKRSWRLSILLKIIITAMQII